MTIADRGIPRMIPDPIFKLGKIPGLHHCEIQKMEYVAGMWRYAVSNNYNPWASGWATEDFIINEIKKNNQPYANKSSK